MTCDRHETGPGSETCPDCLFAMLVETRRALNESEAWAESQERAVDDLRSRASAAEALAAERLEVLRKVESVVGQARALVRTEADDRPLAAIQRLVTRAVEEDS